MSDGHIKKALNEYTVTLHPAWASRCVVQGEDGECEVYKQDKVHRFENGDKHPRKHKIRLEGGRYGRDITLDIDDPKHAIAAIHIELYGERDPMTVRTDDANRVVETFASFNNAETCPPYCDTPPTTPK